MIITKRRRREKKRLRPPRIRIGLSTADETAMKARMVGRYIIGTGERLPATVCSSAWADAQFRSITDRAPDGTEIAVRIFDPNVYPPPADTSPMIVCKDCGVPTPPNCVGSAGRCLDCHCCGAPRQQTAYGATSFHESMEAIRARNLRLRHSATRLGYRYGDHVY